MNAPRVVTIIEKVSADLLRSTASTHWLRHTCGSHAVEQGVPLNVVQQNFGHASLNTTTIYTTQEVETRFDEMERFMQRRG